MTTERRTVPVSERALIGRVNRKLKEDDELLRTARGARAQSDLGRYYVIDLHRNAIIHLDVGLEAFARELGALQPWERLTND